MSAVQPRDFCKGFGEKCLQYFKFLPKNNTPKCIYSIYFFFLRFCLHYF